MKIARPRNPLALFTDNMLKPLRAKVTNDRMDVAIVANIYRSRMLSDVTLTHRVSVAVSVADRQAKRHDRCG